MLNTFDPPLNNFKVHLDEIRQCIAYVRMSVRIQLSLGKVINWGLGDTHEIRLSRSFMELAPFQSRPVFNGMFVTVIAAFEEFLRATISLATKYKACKAKSFKDLEPSFVNRHMEYSGRLLSLINNPPEHLSIDFYDICKRLGTCLPDSTNFEINDIAFSIVRGVTELDTFIDSIKSIGVKFEWDDLGRDKELQKALKTKNTRETSNELKKSIRKIVKTRHKIAHSAQSTADLTEEIFMADIEILRLTANSIAGHLNKSL